MADECGMLFWTAYVGDVFGTTNLIQTADFSYAIAVMDEVR